MPLEPLQISDPTRLGPWQLQHRLGAGGMGLVYLGRSEGRLAAVKAIAPGLAQSADFRARFRREVEVSKRVSGPQVAALYNADVDGPQPWLATEYVDGDTLDRFVADHGVLRGDALVGFAVAVLEGLAQIHRAGVVHRDLKPSNVMLTEHSPVIIDFGIAGAAEATALTATGTVLGSSGWMAPEQVLGRTVGAAADIFGWASLVAFAATGQSPFGSGRPEALAYRIVHQSPDLTGVPAPLVRLLEPAFAQDPDDRPSAEDLLRRIVGSDDSTRVATAIGDTWASDGATRIASTRLGSTPNHSPPPGDRSIRHRPWLAGVAAILVAVFVVGVVVLTRPPGPSDGASAQKVQTSESALTETAEAADATASSVETTTTTSAPALIPASTAPTSSTTEASEPAVEEVPDEEDTLYPAQVPSRVPLCYQQLEFGANGNAWPLFCDDGGLNRAAWEWLAQDDAPVMALGPYASPPDVSAALCEAMQTSTIPIESSRYELAEAYYGWSFGIDLIDEIYSC